MDEAVEKLAAAKALFDVGGEDAVWSAPPADRNKRGEVLDSLHPRASPLSTHDRSE